MLNRVPACFSQMGEAGAYLAASRALVRGPALPARTGNVTGDPRRHFPRTAARCAAVAAAPKSTLSGAVPPIPQPTRIAELMQAHEASEDGALRS